MAAASAAPRVILLSGTPSLSRPYDLFRQVDVLQPGILGRTKEEFAHRCDAVCMHTHIHTHLQLAHTHKAAQRHSRHTQRTYFMYTACRRRAGGARLECCEFVLASTRRYCDRRLVPVRSAHAAPGPNGGPRLRWNNAGGARLVELHGLLVRVTLANGEGEQGGLVLQLLLLPLRWTPGQ